MGLVGPSHTNMQLAQNILPLPKKQDFTVIENRIYTWKQAEPIPRYKRGYFKNNFAMMICHFYVNVTYIFQCSIPNFA